MKWIWYICRIHPYSVIHIFFYPLLYNTHPVQHALMLQHKAHAWAQCIGFEIYGQISIALSNKGSLNHRSLCRKQTRDAHDEFMNESVVYNWHNEKLNLSTIFRLFMIRRTIWSTQIIVYSRINKAYLAFCIHAIA